MCAENKDKSPGAFSSILANKCPHCRQGDLFTQPNPYSLKRSLEMPERCPVCGQLYELQTGFYFGTGYVSYALSIIVLGVVFVAWALTLGLSVMDSSIFWCLGVGIAVLLLVQPVLQRLARSIWIAFFVRYDKNWMLHRKGAGDQH